MQNQQTTTTSTIARFTLGATYITPGAQEALMSAGQTGIEFLRRHVSGDWSGLLDQDAQENETSIREGCRVLSAYHMATGEKIIWIITEADRSSTTILLPSEY